VIFAHKCIKIIFFLKFIFDIISASKQFKNITKKILSKKKFKFRATDVLAAMPNTPLSWTIEGGNSNANFKANLYLIVSNQSFKFFL
jgi:hypothetical protein